MTIKEPVITREIAKLQFIDTWEGGFEYMIKSTMSVDNIYQTKPVSLLSGMKVET